MKAMKTMKAMKAVKDMKRIATSCLYLTLFVLTLITRIALFP